MNKFLKEKLAILLALLLLIPFLWNDTGAVVYAAAATPAFAKSSLELQGIGDTATISIKNKVAKSKYSWSSSNKSVVKVSKGGVVTATGTGTAMIKCKITYPSKSVKTLSCKTVVRVPATEVNIKDLPMKNNAYQLTLNGTVDLDAVLTPADTTDKLYWYIDEDNVLSDPTCVTLDSKNQGIVTGIKVGKAVVRVKAAKSAAATATVSGPLDDTIIIEVAAPTASVKSSDIVQSNEISVVFDSAVQKSTVVNTDGTLSSNITLSLCTVNKVIANDPGRLSASLSSDSKTLTITTEKDLRGTYGIHFSNKILTTTGISVEDYYKQMSFIDITAPYILNVTNDDSGMVANINFSEAIDFTDFAVKPASVANSTTVSNTTLSILSLTSNYVISKDKKSVSINLSNIASADYGKYFMVNFAGIKDLAGNAPTTSTLQTIVMTDTTPKPQAQLLTLQRTGYDKLTAYYDRGIKIPGYIQINGNTIYGVVDTTDLKKVTYTLTSLETSYTGLKTVSIGSWNSFNVVPSELSVPMTSRTVDFTIETNSPYLINTDFDLQTNLLTLTYSEPITLPVASGIFTATLTTRTEEIISGININYTSMLHNLGNNVIQLKLTIGGSQTGSLAFTIPQGFAQDGFKNASISKAMVISNSSGTGELPGPYMLMQSSTNLNEITLMFSNKLDVASATNAGNYKIPGVTILSARVDSNSTDTGATVVLTVQTIDVTSPRKITITGVKGYNNSYSAISNYEGSITLKENQAPVYLDPPVFDTTTKNTVKMNFSEQIQGSLSVTVVQIYGSTQTTLSPVVTVNGNCATIGLGTVPTNGSYLKITIISNNITDAAGNKATFASSTIGVGASY